MFLFSFTLNKNARYFVLLRKYSPSLYLLLAFFLYLVVIALNFNSDVCIEVHIDAFWVCCIYRPSGHFCSHKLVMKCIIATMSVLSRQFSNELCKDGSAYEVTRFPSSGETKYIMG